MKDCYATYHVGQVVYHKILNYRGVVIDVDPVFAYSGENEIENLAKAKAACANYKEPTERPWYRVLVDDSIYITYVNENELAADQSSQPIEHPELSLYFSDFVDGHYACKQLYN